MFRKYGIGILAFIIAASSAAFTTQANDNLPKSQGNFTDYYYRFTGGAGSESDMSKWLQLTDAAAYSGVNCPSGSAKGCKIINTTNDGSGHPTSVPLDGSGLPEVSGANAAVANRN